MLKEVVPENKKQNQLDINYTDLPNSKDFVKEIELSLLCFDVKSSSQSKHNLYMWLDNAEKLIRKETNISRRLSYNIRRIKKAYFVEDEKKLTQFVVNNQEIVTLLLAAQKQIRKYFPQEKLTLGVFLEYEHTEWERVKVSIYVDSNNFDEAFDKLSQFDNDWWLDNCSGIGLKLYIGLEFE